MTGVLFSNTAKQVYSASHENVREVFLEAICILSESSTSFILKVNDDTAQVVRSTLPSLLGIELQHGVLPVDHTTKAISNGELEDWKILPPVNDGRMKSILMCRFNYKGEHFLACAGKSTIDAYSEEVVESFADIAALGEHTIKVLRDEARHEKDKQLLRTKIEKLNKQIASTQTTADQLEGANAQLSNALLEVSSAKAQSKALLITVGIGILLFAISEFRIEPWLESSGVSERAVTYQKILILGGLVPVQVLVERFISSKVNSNASQIRITMYEEVLSVLLEDGALTEKELRWLELYRRQQGITREEAQLVEAKLRAKLLQKNRKTLQEDARAVPM